MSKILKIVMMAFVAISVGACGGMADNKPAANNANAAKPAATAPTADALLALDKQANEAYFKGDSKFFEGFLSDKFVILGPDGSRMDKTATTKMIAGVKCDIKEGWKLEDPQVSTIDADTYVLSYKGTFDGTCNDGPGGKVAKVRSPIRAATVWVRNGDKWQAAFHGENMIIDPKNPPPPPAKADDKKDDAKADDKAAANSNTAAPAKPTPSANTDALTKIHNSGWEAWKAKDAKKLEEITTKDIAFADPIGGWISGQANVVKSWIDMKCEGITKVSFTEGFASAVSPTVEILTGKGTADGTCDGQKNGDLWTTAVYVKEGDAWKLAFMIESAGM